MLRRGYSYSLGVTNPGNWIWGCCLSTKHDLEKGFLTVQKGSMAKRWRNTLNLSAAVFALPGVKDANDYFGSALLRV